MIFQELDQDDDCSHSILVSEEGDLTGDGQDWQTRTEGILASVLEAFTN